MPLSVETYDRIEDAARAAGERDARLLGGGTLVMRAVNYGADFGDARGEGGFSRIIRVTDPALRRISAQGDRVVIGAQATMADVIAARETDFLADAARSVGGPAIRRMATVGGNLFAWRPFGDFATALLAAGASVQLAGAGAGRETPLEDFFAARDRNPRPVVAAISVPRPAAGALRYHKVARVHPRGASVLCLAALLPMQAGRVTGARIAWGSMGATPLRGRGAERALEGRALDEAGIAPAVAAATEGLDPPDDGLASAWHRREIAPVHLRRLLLGD